MVKTMKHIEENRLQQIVITLKLKQLLHFIFFEHFGMSLSVVLILYLVLLSSLPKEFVASVCGFVFATTLFCCIFVFFCKMHDCVRKW